MLVPIALRFGHAFLIKGERAVLVDTGSAKDATALEAAMARQGVSAADLTLILHTHGHWDHAGSTAHLSRRSAAKIAVHAADAPMMRRGDNGTLRATCLTAFLLKPLLDRSYPAVEPDLLIEHEINLARFGVAARVVFTPGHTAGSISVMTGEGDLLVGDLLMGGFVGGKIRPGRPGFHYFAENAGAARASIRKALALSPRRLYPTHGGPLDPADVALWLGRLAD